MLMSEVHPKIRNQMAGYASDHAMRHIDLKFKKGDALVPISCSTWNLMNRCTSVANNMEASQGHKQYSNNPLDVDENDEQYIARKEAQLKYLLESIQEKKQDFIFLQEPDILTGYFSIERLQSIQNEFKTALEEKGYALEVSQAKDNCRFNVILYNKSKWALAADTAQEAPGILPNKANKVKQTARQRLFKPIKSSLEDFRINVFSIHGDYNHDYGREIQDYVQSQAQKGYCVIGGGDYNHNADEIEGLHTLEGSSNIDCLCEENASLPYKDEQQNTILINSVKGKTKNYDGFHFGAGGGWGVASKTLSGDVFNIKDNKLVVESTKQLQRSPEEQPAPKQQALSFGRFIPLYDKTGQNKSINVKDAISQNNIDSTNTIFLFPGNDLHVHEASKNHSGGGLAQLAQDFGRHDIASIGLPTTYKDGNNKNYFTIYDDDEEAIKKELNEINQPYYKKLWELVGQGKNIVTVMRNTQQQIETIKQGGNKPPFYQETQNGYRLTKEAQHFSDLLNESYPGIKNYDLAFYGGIEKGNDIQHKVAASQHFNQLNKIIMCLNELQQAKAQEAAIAILCKHDVEKAYIDAFEQGLQSQSSASIEFNDKFIFENLPSQLATINQEQQGYQVSLAHPIDKKKHEAVINVTTPKNESVTQFSVTSKKIRAENNFDDTTIEAMVDLYKKQHKGNIIKITQKNLCQEELEKLFVRAAEQNLICDNVTIRRYGLKEYKTLLRNHLTEQQIEQFNGMVKELVNNKRNKSKSYFHQTNDQLLLNASHTKNASSLSRDETKNQQGKLNDFISTSPPR